MTEEKIEQTFTPITYAQLSKLIIADLNSINTTNKTVLLTKYTKEQIIGLLENPVRSEVQLRKLSQYLYSISPNYKRLIKYFAEMLRFDYIVEPYDLNTEKVDIQAFKKNYLSTLKVLEVMNIPHEFTKIMKHAFRDDVFYGYEHMAEDSYFIQRLEPDYCKINSIEDGVYNYAFDFSYFKNDDEVKKYPSEFIEKYSKYKSNRSEFRWQELDSKNTICFKVNEELDYPIPPFSGVFESLFDIDENKRMRKVKNKMDNYMILTQKIPIDDKTSEPNKFLIDLDTAIAFHNKATQSLPEEVGLVTSPMEIQAIKLERKNKDSDNVAEAERNYYNAAGVSQVLFNADKVTSSGLTKSVITDEQIVFSCLLQFERWLNRKLKNLNKKNKFRVKFLKTTNFNIDTIRDGLLKSAQYGLPVKSALAATLDLTPSSFANMIFLENEILGLQDKLIPLASAHTTSGKESNGAPKKNEGDLTESGDKTKETDGNIRE
jgi:hypothetical protein